MFLSDIFMLILIDQFQVFYLSIRYCISGVCCFVLDAGGENQ